jgi:zinc transporter ZupT
MEWKDIGSLIGKTAPALGALLAPVTGGASLAIGGMIGSLLGTEPTPTAIAKAIEANPELALKLKELDIRISEMNHEEKMSLINDIKDARDMQKVALNQGDIFSKRFIYYFAIGITSISFLYIFLVTFVPIPKDNVRFADTVLGFLLGIGLAQIFNFFYGSSKSSSDKTEHLMNIVKK